jgi:hypothetical protein
VRTLSHVHRINTDFGAMYWLIDHLPDGTVINAMIAHRRLNEDQAVTKLVEQLSDSLAEALADIGQTTPASKAE